jgi:hypothetical protein
MVSSSKGFGPEKDYAGDDQQHIQKTDPSSRQRGCYIRNISARVQLKKSRRDSQGGWPQPPVVK